MRPPKLGERGYYHPMRLECGVRYGAADARCVADVVHINDDDTLNLSVLNWQGRQFSELEVPTKDNADDGVHFWEPLE